MPRQPAPGTRDKILGVASRLFYEHGVRAVGMSRIITEAGTGKNLLYQHFPTKSDLVAAYLEQAGERRRDATRRALAEAGNGAAGAAGPAGQLVAVVAEVGRLVERPGFRGCAFRNYLAEFPDDDSGRPDEDGSVPAVAPAVVAREYLAGSRQLIEGLVAELGVADPVRLTEQLWLLVDALYVQAAYREPADRHLGVEAAVALAQRLVAV
ncbi:TetR/AcrR family transcriptional regulator [Actinomycetospora termitidis]|uniref:Helix-turn-helix domain-containing protein n=1 Tax=Actinomycetospora termitidis TaxID=3053470 RepID=A0ABT7M5N3_9PSEU|nr:helix-turn-helix domain-containing protein [Actinomycetospora sp. Odt1-22]MDL5155853.1 helix-turn-helix domain-containing protein [Actinomycetospora sp. Odt1-22]